MADITKCTGIRPSDGKECPQRSTCYRYTAPVMSYQWWFEAPFTEDGCSEYWPTGSIPLKCTWTNL